MLIKKRVYLLKKKLLHMVIHVRKIFNCFKCRCQSVLNVVSEWYFRKRYRNSDGSCFYLVVLLPLVLNKKQK